MELYIQHCDLHRHMHVLPPASRGMRHEPQTIACIDWLTAAVSVGTQICAILVIVCDYNDHRSYATGHIETVKHNAGVVGLHTIPNQCVPQ